MNRRSFLLGTTAVAAIAALPLAAAAKPETRRVKFRAEGLPPVDLDVPVGHHIAVTGTRVEVWKREGDNFIKVSEMDCAIGRNGYSPDATYLFTDPVR